MLIYYIVIINLIEFILMRLDKLFAIKHKERIPEITLLFLSFIGGSLGAMLGMIIFKHKTRKWKFKIIFTLSLLIHILIIIKL